ncbi:MAG: PAS domain-containing protein, partial [Bellilinea sp.]
MPLPLLKVYPIMRSTRRKIISRIIILYTVVSAVWILASDSILFALVSDSNVVRSISIYKGWVFIAITAVLLAGILYRELKNLEAAQNLGQESEQRFRLLYQDAPVGFHSLDSNAVILEVNRLWCETLGYSSDQVIGKPFSQFIAAVSQDHFRTTFDKINKRGKTSFETELEMLHANGSTILTSISGRVVRDPESGVPNIYCTLQNVTEQRLLVMETRQQREEYRQIIDTVPAHIFYLDPQQVVMRTNQAAALQLKSTPVELVGKPLRSLLPHYADLVDDGF